MLLECYQADLRRPEFRHDAAQENAVQQLARVQQELVSRYEAAREANALSRFRIARQARVPVRGLYMWGGVGRGKTYLMDLFFDSLPFRRKLRMHFHRFMQRVHRELKELQGTVNPLEVVADHLHQEAVVICFDEFFVTDITDAMILGGLFEQLFLRGVTLVATSNIEPDRLYWNGLQRERFLPAIAVLKQNVDVLNVDSGVDYRRRALEQADLYYTPLGDEANAHLETAFKHLSNGMPVSHELIHVNYREVEIRARTKDVLWCNYDELCEKPRSAEDCIELAREFQTVLLSDVPQMGGWDDNATRRFINMIDEFYDRSVKLIISAAVPIAELYAGTRLKFEFERTKSRLLEMQSTEYIGREHKP
jgi:cell division protein ZapE